MSIRLTHRNIVINAQNDFRSIDLGQLKGTVLALDWVVGKAHHIWGSAVMVAPGVALTARHVFEDMLNAGLTSGPNGYVVALGFNEEILDIWNVDSLSCFHNGSDLAVLTLVRTPSGDRDPEEIFSISPATIAARQPELGETVSLIGFVATKSEFADLHNGNAASISLNAGVGQVNDLYPDRCSARLPNPSFSVLAKTINGVSGGAAFDPKGRLIGVISSGIGDDITFVSQAWPCLFTPLSILWPPQLVDGPTTLHELAGRGFCRIDGLDAVRSYVGADGQPHVSLVWKDPQQS